MISISATALRSAAHQSGLTSIGWTRIADAPPVRAALEQWLADDRHGDMAWMARDPARRSDPRCIVPDVASVISVSLNYYTPHAQTDDARRGRISRYAWGADYHDVLLAKVTHLAEWMCAQHGDIVARPYVDTGAVMEKPWAMCAGLGWQGKHTNLIDPRRGSWHFLGEIITNAVIADSVDVAQSVPRAAQPSCGTCTRCIDVCPTRAITAPYQLDPRRCIAYLTIEHKGSIPEDLRPLLGNHIYGCDICQDVCPWNRFATPTPEPAFAPRAGNLNPVLIPLLDLTDEQFRTRFAASPIKRLKRARFLRNVCVALGNSGDAAALPALERAARDSEPLIAEHAQWAMARITK